MAKNVSDGLFWTVLLAGGFAAGYLLSYNLYTAKELAIIAEPQTKPPKPQLQRDAEAAIEPSTLFDLTEGPSYNLAASAIRLSVSRFLKSDAKGTLLHHLASKDHKLRDRAINALRLLFTNTALKEQNVKSQFADDATWRAFVTALVNLLPEHDRLPRPSVPPSPIRPHARPAHEVAILDLLNVLLNERYIIDVKPLNAGIITRWLKHYPFPCTLTEQRRWNFKRHDVCHLMRNDEWGKDDEPMSQLINILMKSSIAQRQFADVGLISESLLNKLIGSRDPNMTSPLDNRNRSGRPFFSNTFSDRYDVEDDDDDSDDDLQEGQLIDDAEMMARLQELPAHTNPHSQARSAQTEGERSLRRRHRQAIVVAEAGVPLSEDNILQRLPTETDVTWHDEVAERQEHILRNAIQLSSDANRPRNTSIHGDFSNSSVNAVGQIAMERIDGIDDSLAVGVWEGPIPPQIDLEWADSDMDADEDDEDDDDEDEDEDEEFPPY